MALQKERAFLRVDAAGEKKGVSLQRVAAERGGVLTHGDGVQVGQREYAAVLLLQSHPVFNGAQVIAQRNGAAGLYGAENNLFRLSFCFDFHVSGTPIFYLLRSSLASRPNISMPFVSCSSVGAV